MQHYFIKGEEKKRLIRLKDKDTIKHMFQVMRLSTDEQFVATLDSGDKFLARVSDKDSFEIELLEGYASSTELPVKVTIAMGFPKGDKLEFLAQKVTELGASELWAYPGDWSVVKWDSKKLLKKQDKLEKIAQGAAEQSKRHMIPNIKLFHQKKDFIERFQSFDTIILAYEESAKVGEKSQFHQQLIQLKKGSRVLIIFGPEGGISPAEYDIFTKESAHPCGLGPRILRTETAPLYALSAISYVLELS